jgi:hypothetical protein
MTEPLTNFFVSVSYFDRRKAAVPMAVNCRIGRVPVWVTAVIRTCGWLHRLIFDVEKGLGPLSDRHAAQHPRVLSPRRVVSILCSLTGYLQLLSSSLGESRPLYCVGRHVTSRRLLPPRQGTASPFKPLIGFRYSFSCISTITRLRRVDIIPPNGLRLGMKWWKRDAKRSLRSPQVQVTDIVIPSSSQG